MRSVSRQQRVCVIEGRKGSLGEKNHYPAGHLRMEGLGALDRFQQASQGHRKQIFKTCSSFLAMNIK